LPRHTRDPARPARSAIHTHCQRAPTHLCLELVEVHIPPLLHATDEAVDNLGDRAHTRLGGRQRGQAAPALLLVRLLRVRVRVVQAADGGGARFRLAAAAEGGWLLRLLMLLLRQHGACGAHAVAPGGVGVRVRVVVQPRAQLLVRLRRCCCVSYRTCIPADIYTKTLGFMCISRDHSSSLECPQQQFCHFHTLTQCLSFLLFSHNIEPTAPCVVHQRYTSCTTPCTPCQNPTSLVVG
jgi:hypothetical protein